jgi:hypothetical protein
VASAQLVAGGKGGRPGMHGHGGSGGRGGLGGAGYKKTKIYADGHQSVSYSGGGWNGRRGKNSKE